MRCEYGGTEKTVYLRLRAEVTHSLAETMQRSLNELLQVHPGHFVIGEGKYR